MRATPTPFAEGGSGTRRFSGYKYKCKLVQPLWKMTGQVVITWTLGLHGRSHSLARSPKEQKATSVKRWARKWSQQLNLQLLKTGPGAHRWEEDEEAGLPHKGAASNKEAHRWKITDAHTTSKPGAKENRSHESMWSSNTCILTFACLLCSCPF